MRQGDGYQFINPLLECETSQQMDSKYIPFENNTKDRIQNEIIETHPNVFLAVYFRNLNNGPWFGINHNADFAPASLLKVPLMMAYYKYAESDPEILKKQITFDKDYSAELPNQTILPGQKIEFGKSYAVEDLIRYMIVYSDNNALALLSINMSADEIYKIYTDLGVRVPDSSEPTDFMTVKEYASFFRMLYNASYLSRNYSEKAMELLSQVEFKGGLTGGVPSGISVAHKFGERLITSDTDTIQQLHDCGVVYYPGYPYLLCLMTKGKDNKENSEVVQAVSRIVYEEVSQAHPTSQ